MKKRYFRSGFEMTIILFSIGGIFALLGILFLLGTINISHAFTFSIALSGLLLITADILLLLSNRYYKSEKKSLHFLSKFLYFLRIIFLVGSLLALFAFPYISFNDSINLETWATGLSIIAIGLTIVNISLNHHVEQVDDIEHIIKLAERSAETASKALEMAEKSQKEESDKLITTITTPQKNS